MNREAMLDRLATHEVFDVLVIGGGATGLGCALDAQARGFSTLLVEAHDFAKGTSSRSTKLVHGGVRYLAQGRIGLVREALRERGLMLRNAPHLVRAIGFVMPAYRRRDQLFYGLGLKLYDALAGRLSLGGSHLLSRARTQSLLPTVRSRNLVGGVRYFDGQFDDARLAITLMRTLLDLGGIAINYLPAVALCQSDGRVCGAELQDAESGRRFEVRARAVINATGVHVDVLRRLDEPAALPMLKPSQGVHLVVDGDFLPGADALLVPRTDDGRVLFMVPWHGKLLLGTTDTPRDTATDEPRAAEEEIDFILRTAAHYLVRPPTRADVRSVFAGLRPLVQPEAVASTAGISREHVISVSASGLLSITGGKWTTYRRMAADAIETLIARGDLSAAECRTADLLLRGAGDHEAIGPYGTDWPSVRALEGARRKLHPRLDLTEAQVRYAVREEAARNVEDVLARRHRALFLDARAAAEAAPEVARLMREELRRDAGWERSQVALFSGLARQYQL